MNLWLQLSMSALLCLLSPLAVANASEDYHDHGEYGHHEDGHAHEHDWNWHFSLHGHRQNTPLLQEEATEQHVALRLGVCNNIFCAGPAIAILDPELGISFWLEGHGHTHTTTSIAWVAEANYEPSEECFEGSFILAPMLSEYIGIGVSGFYTAEGLGGDPGITAEIYAAGAAFLFEVDGTVDVHISAGKGFYHSLDAAGQDFWVPTSTVHGGIEFRF